MSFCQSSFLGSVSNCRLANLRVLCLFSFFWLPLASTLAQESIIYSQSFSDCSGLTFGNAAEEGYSQYSADVNFECTTQGPSGLYNGWVGGDGDGSAAPAPLFETADDGFVMVDSDLLGSEGPIENCWFELNEPVDCSGFSEVSIAFDTFYRRWQNNFSGEGEQCLLEMSFVQGVWPDPTTVGENEGVGTYGGIPVTKRINIFPDMVTNDQTTNPQTMRFNIGEFVSQYSGFLPSEIYFRWRWVGSWGYAWMVDDFVVFETPQYDLAVEEATLMNYASTGLFESRVWPLSQLPPGGFPLAVEVKNVGWDNLEDLALEGTINGVDPNPMFTTFGGGSLSVPVSLLPGSETTLTTNGLDVLESYGVGERELNISVSSSDPLISNTANEPLSVEITNHIYGRDDGMVLSNVGSSFYADMETQPYLAGVPFDVFSDMTIYGIDVAVTEGTQTGAVIAGSVLAFDGNPFDEGPYDALLASTPPFEVESDDVSVIGQPAVWKTLVFEEPLFVPAGERVMAAMEHFGGDSVQLGLGADQAPQTVFVSYQGGEWLWASKCPMVRLNLDPSLACLGCLDAAACNYDPSACGDDGSCVFAVGCQVCDGQGGLLDGDADQDGICDDDEVSGCTDELAWNYNDQATDSDDSCLYGPNGCASIGDANWSGFDLGAYPVEFSLMYGVSAEEETVVHVPATMVEAASGSTFSVQDLTLMNVVGMPQGMSVDFPEAAIGADQQACAVWSGTPAETGTFVVTWTGDLILSLFGAPFPVGEFEFEQVITVAENPNPILGCMYNGAQNYVAFATVDDGNCIIPGCTDSEALNYHPIFNVEDESCLYSEDFGGVSNCPSDINGDGLISVGDLLVLLGQFGLSCAE